MQDNTEINLDNILNTGENSNRQAPITGISTHSVEPIEPIEPIKPIKPIKPVEGEEQNQVPTEHAQLINEENNNSFKALLTSFTDESTLDADNKSIRTDLLAKYKGTSFDENGNIVNDKGEIVTPFDTLLKESLEEDEVTMDAEGNQVDAEGNIVKTKVELAVENTVVNKWHAESGYEFVDEKGNTKVYTDDEAGHKEFRDDLVAQQGKEWREEFFNKTPELAEVAKHLLAGKSMDTYKSNVDYSTIDIKTLTPSEKESYIRKSYEIAGLDKARVDDLIQLFKDSNKLDSEIEKALPALQANEVKAKQQRDLDYQQTIKDEQARQMNYWNTVEQVVTKGQLNDIKIPDTDKAAFFDYLSTAIDSKGNSKEFLDSQKETLEQQLQIKYLRFKGYDLSKLVETKVKEAKVLNLKERIKQSAKIKSTPINDANKSKTSGGQDITIDAMLS
jgi:hypothetical protein